MNLPPRLAALIRTAWSAGASSIHLVAGQRPRCRAESELRVLEELPLPPEEVAEWALALFGERRLSRQAQEGTASASFRLDHHAFGRATLATTLGHYAIGIRLRAAGAPPSLDTLGVPPVVRDLLGAGHGLLLVAGPHGSGKTTTLYGMLQWLNEERALHICTVEDPIGFELVPGKALLQQREVGTDVPDVASGIAAALEQDLDVLMIGGLTDLESLSAAVHAAETGHLVLLQVHAHDAHDALQRLIEAAPDSMQPVIRRSLAETLRGVVAQRLLPRQPRGRIAVHQVLVPDERLRATLAAGGALGDCEGAPESVAMRAEVDAHEAAGRISPEAAQQARGWLRP